jgi:hypothetical protein
MKNPRLLFISAKCSFDHENQYSNTSLQIYEIFQNRVDNVNLIKLLKYIALNKINFYNHQYNFQKGNKIHQSNIFAAIKE